jgi:hypothetical protein
MREERETREGGKRRWMKRRIEDKYVKRRGEGEKE